MLQTHDNVNFIFVLSTWFFQVVKEFELLGLSLIIPEHTKWVALARKFKVELTGANCEMFVSFLTNYLQDDIGLLSAEFTPSDEEFQIVKKENSYYGYIGNIPFFKDIDLFRMIFSGIGIHIIFGIELPQRMVNLSIFLSCYFDNVRFWKESDKKKPKLPARVQRKLKEDNILS